MPAAVADKKGEYFERTIYSTFSGGKQLAGFQVKRDFIGAGRIYRSCVAMKREYLRKGSFTIEAACVMSLVLLVLMGVLYLTFFVHNRAWLTAAACESALTGSMEGIRKDGQAEQAAESRCRELGNVGFFPWFFSGNFMVFNLIGVPFFKAGNIDSYLSGNLF